MFYEKLLITDGSFRPVPWLAESWTNNPEFITQDEESSGIIDASHILGRG